METEYTLSNMMNYIDKFLTEREESDPQDHTNAASDQEIAEEIAKNIKDEWMAVEGYQKLLTTLKESDADPRTIAQVEEIISDELNHAEVLRREMKKYDGGINTAKD